MGDDYTDMYKWGSPNMFSKAQGPTQSGWANAYAPQIKSFNVGNPVGLNTGDDIGRQDWFGALNAMPKYAQSLAAPAETSMWDSLLGFGKKAIGTSNDPGPLSWGFGALSNIYKLNQGRQQFKEMQRFNNANMEYTKKSLNDGVSQYNNALEDKAAYRFSNLEGKRTGSAENNAYVEKYVKEKGLKNV